MINIILALLPIGLLLHSFSSNFCSCIFTWSCSARTELLQKGVFLVRILTGGDRISICFFEPGDLRFRPDSGQMEEDLDDLLLEKLNLIMFALEDLQQAQDQSEEELIVVVINAYSCNVSQIKLPNFNKTLYLFFTKSWSP